MPRFYSSHRGLVITLLLLGLVACQQQEAGAARLAVEVTPKAEATPVVAAAEPSVVEPSVVAAPPVVEPIEVTPRVVEEEPVVTAEAPATVKAVATTPRKVAKERAPSSAHADEAPPRPAVRLHKVARTTDQRRYELKMLSLGTVSGDSYLEPMVSNAIVKGMPQALHQFVQWAESHGLEITRETFTVTLTLRPDRRACDVVFTEGTLPAEVVMNRIALPLRAVRIASHFLEDGPHTSAVKFQIEAKPKS